MASVSNFVSKDKGLFKGSIYAFIPKHAVVPLVQDDEKDTELEILVEPGETVSEGQLIARKGEALIHSSIPGRVEQIENCQYPDGMQGKAATIAFSGAFTYTGKKLAEKSWADRTPQDLSSHFAELGVVNTFSGCKPLSSQIDRLPPEKDRLLVVRLFDDDPSRALENYLVLKEQEKVTGGIVFIAQAMAAKGIVAVYAKKQAPLPLEQVTALDGTSIPVLTIKTDASRYPSGSSRDIALAVKKQTKEAPWSAISAYDLYIDAQTAVGAYEAAAFSKPMTERYVHVTGSCLNAAAILRVKIGTTLRSLAEHCGGFKKPPARIIINGLLDGNAVGSLDIPVTKQVKSVEYQAASQVKNNYAEACIRCGECHAVCPVKLFPDRMYRAFAHGNFASDREKQASRTANLCIQCGLCNAVCPSRLPLCQTMPLL